MEISFDQIIEANKTIKTMPIERKDKKTGIVSSKEYAVVNERIKAFRMLYPCGCITTELLSDDGERCMFRAVISDENCRVLGTGTAFELKSSSFINASSYIENCETSAVGRALAMCGIGIDASIASYEEVANAIKNQPQEEPKKEEKKQPANEETRAEYIPGYPKRDELIALANKYYPEGSVPRDNLLKCWGIEKLEDASTAQLTIIYRKYSK